MAAFVDTMQTPTRERVAMATLMMFMYTYGLSMNACVAWSTAQHAAAAACFGAAAATYPLARQAQGCWASPRSRSVTRAGRRLAQDVSGKHAGMQGFAMRRTRKVDYVDDGTYFDYSFSRTE